MATDHEIAIFEAAIKLGALYHQWVGTPVSRKTAGILENVMEESTRLQPYVHAIKVQLDRDLMDPNPYGYSEVRGLMFHVEITTKVGESWCEARLAPRGDYPYMEIVACR